MICMKELTVKKKIGGLDVDGRNRKGGCLNIAGKEFGLFFLPRWVLKRHVRLNYYWVRM